MGRICPGQDTRYWRPGDIYDVQCGNCGASVEFFKDDLRHRCRSCGTLIQNPKITLGCAQWCEHARECLGYDPTETLAETDLGGGDSSFLQQLEVAIGSALHGSAGESERLALSLAVTDAARSLLRDVDADRKVVLAAAMILGAANGEPLDMVRETWAPQILDQVGLDGTTKAQIIDVIASLDDKRSPEADLLQTALERAKK